MRKYWYRRILIMAVVFSVAVGGSYYLIRNRQEELKQEVNAGTAGSGLVIPGGMPIGIYLETDGVMVLGTQAVPGTGGIEKEPARNLVSAGDYITAINGTKIRKKTELIEVVNQLDQEDVVLDIERDGSETKVRFQAVADNDGDYKLGIWVRDNAQGLGTITFLNADSQFGALGHGIHDVDTSQLLKTSKGTVYSTSIKDVQKGTSGNPGGMEGIIVYNNYNVLGSISKNTEEGIYGKIDRIDALFGDQTPMETAVRDEIREGPAVIRCAVEGDVKEYEIRITKVDRHAQEVNKGLEIEVTDERLLKAAGGIVQGMSGSPIIQNGKLIGAVTHVFVKDSSRGYGIFIENMLKNVDSP